MQHPACLVTTCPVRFLHHRQQSSKTPGNFHSSLSPHASSTAACAGHQAPPRTGHIGHMLFIAIPCPALPSYHHPQSPTPNHPHLGLTITSRPQVCPACPMRKGACFACDKCGGHCDAVLRCAKQAACLAALVLKVCVAFLHLWDWERLENKNWHTATWCSCCLGNVGSCSPPLRVFACVWCDVVQRFQMASTCAYEQN